MNNDLTKRLIERKFNRDVDMNPEGLSLEQIKALDLTKENWDLLAEIEQGRRKPRADVIAWAGEAAGKAKSEKDLEAEEGEPEPDPTVTGQLEPGRENLELPEEVLHPRSTEAGQETTEGSGDWKRVIKKDRK